MTSFLTKNSKFLLTVYFQTTVPPQTNYIFWIWSQMKCSGFEKKSYDIWNANWNVYSALLGTKQTDIIWLDTFWQHLLLLKRRSSREQRVTIPSPNNWVDLTHDNTSLWYVTIPTLQLWSQLSFWWGYIMQWQTRFCCKWQRQNAESCFVVFSPLPTQCRNKKSACLFIPTAKEFHLSS